MVDALKPKGCYPDNFVVTFYRTLFKNMFPQNDEEMGRALNNLAVELVRRKKIHEEKYKKFLEYWHATPRYLEIKKLAKYNRQAAEDERGYRWNAWIDWLKVESEAEKDSKV